MSPNPRVANHVGAFCVATYWEVLGAIISGFRKRFRTVTRTSCPSKNWDTLAPLFGAIAVGSWQLVVPTLRPMTSFVSGSATMFCGTRWHSLLAQLLFVNLRFVRSLVREALAQATRLYSVPERVLGAWTSWLWQSIPRRLGLIMHRSSPGMH